MIIQKLNLKSMLVGFSIAILLVFTTTMIFAKTTPVKQITVVKSTTSVKVNGASLKNDSPAINYNNRIYVPVRNIAEALGATVEWNAKENIVEITQLDNEESYIDSKVNSVIPTPINSLSPSNPNQSSNNFAPMTVNDSSVTTNSAPILRSESTNEQSPSTSVTPTEIASSTPTPIPSSQAVNINLMIDSNTGLIIDTVDWVHDETEGQWHLKPTGGTEMIINKSNANVILVGVPLPSNFVGWRYKFINNQYVDTVTPTPAPTSTLLPDVTATNTPLSTNTPTSTPTMAPTPRPATMPMLVYKANTDYPNVVYQVFDSVTDTADGWLVVKGSDTHVEMKNSFNLVVVQTSTIPSDFVPYRYKYITSSFTLN